MIYYRTNVSQLSINHSIKLIPILITYKDAACVSEFYERMYTHAHTGTRMYMHTFVCKWVISLAHTIAAPADVERGRARERAERRVCQSESVQLALSHNYALDCCCCCWRCCCCCCLSCLLRPMLRKLLRRRADIERVHSHLHQHKRMHAYKLAHTHTRTHSRRERERGGPLCLSLKLHEA